MDMKDVGGLIGKAAPMLGMLVGGPAGPIVAAVSSMISSALGCDNTPEAINANLATNPDAYVKLKEIELQNAAQLQQMVLTHTQAMAQIDANDRDSARKREMAIGGYITPILAILAMLTAIGLVYYIVVGKATADQDAREYINLIIGYVFAIVTQVMNYYFGSSASSARKDDAIANSMPLK